MPRKKTATKDVFEKSQVSDSFNAVKILLETKIAETVANLVSEETVTREKAQRVQTVMQAVANNCVDTIRANKGL